METFLIVVGFIIVCVAGIAWDYFKPTRFRTSYRNVAQKRHDGGGFASGGDHVGKEGPDTFGSFGDGGSGGDGGGGGD